MRPQIPTHPDDDRLLELAYGEVTGTEARALRTHVDGCPRCRTVLDGIAEVRTALRALPSEPAPDRGLDSLLAYGEQAAARARSRRRGMRIVGVLSTVAALAVIWVVLPPARKQADGEARAPAPGVSDGLARADRERAPAQGDSAKDEQPAKAGVPAPAATPVPSAPRLAKTEAPVPEKRKELAKRDTLAELKALAQPTAAGRAESAALDRTSAQSSASGALAGAGAAPSGGTAISGGVGMKKSAAGADVAANRAAPPASPAASAEEMRAQDAAKVVVSPFAEVLATQPLAKAAPASESAVRAVQAPQPSARVGAGSAEQQARLAQIQQKLTTARGDERKALLLEQCELEASLGRGPDAVLTCSTVSREFPGTPEATRASKIARGFSLQLPAEPSER